MYNILQDVLFALVLKNPSKEWYIKDTDKQAHEVSFLFASLILQSLLYSFGIPHHWAHTPSPD